MARMTQFIGLTSQATQFVFEFVEIKNTGRSTSGMFDEPIPLGTWVDSENQHYVEVVQCEPWSSGPMIFTAIKKSEIVNNRHVPFGDFIHPWTFDPRVRGEVDFGAGLYCV